MAKIKSGQLYLTKKEVECLRTIINHTRADISFDGGGSYNMGDADNSPDKKAEAKAVEAIGLIEFIIESAVVK